MKYRIAQVCPTCGHEVAFDNSQRWEDGAGNVALLVGPEKDGAIMEWVGRGDAHDGLRFVVSYDELLIDWRRCAVAERPAPFPRRDRGAAHG